MSETLVDNADKHRFEMRVDGGFAFVAYRFEGDVLVLDHAEVPSALEGQGVGSRLVRATLDVARTRGLKVVARCGFVRAYMRRHPEFDDIRAG